MMNPLFLRTLAVAMAVAAAPSLAQAQLNVASGKTATSSAATYPGYPPSNLVDNNVTTFTHPNAASGTLGFQYQVDFGASHELQEIRLYNRNNCCPERLSNYRVSLHNLDDGTGLPGPAVWTADVRTDGTNSGQGGIDFLNATANPAGTFTGRYLRVTNLSNAGYNPQIAEIMAFSEGPDVPNKALYKPVTASAATWSGLPAANITDGNPATISHPLASSGTTGFSYTVDLLKSFVLDRIVVTGRGDGCCPERLRRYRVEVLADNNGVPGAAAWSGDLHMDGSYPANGGSDVVTGASGAGTFSGRFVRITNLSNESYNPQIAEVEVYQAPGPTIAFFGSNVGNITATAAPGMPTAATLSWTVSNATSLSLDQGIGPVIGPSGFVSVSPASHRVYTLTATNAAGSSTATVTIGVDEPVVPPRLNELVAENGGALADEDGDASDWVEIHNPATYSVNLAGAHLTDNAGSLTKWTFPAVMVPPGGYRVVFASGKNRAVVGAELHAGFQLSKGGEYLGLVAPDGTTIWDELAPQFPEQKQSASYGRNAVSQWRYFSTATPGAVNAGTEGIAFVADTVFSVRRGIYNSAQSVGIACATPGAQIRYTTDGKVPTATTGTVYSAPIAVSTTTVIRAAAFAADSIPSNVDTHTYIFPSSVVSSPVMLTSITQDPTYGPQMISALTSVPTVSVALPDMNAINNDTEVASSVEYLDPSVTTGGAPAGVSVPHANGGIQFYGGAFTNFTKKSFRIAFRQKYGDAKLAGDLFPDRRDGWRPAGKFDAIELRSGSHDMNQRGFYMANLYVDQALGEMGQLQPHGRMVHLYFNGTYWGLYHLRERWDASMHADYLGGKEEHYEAINGNYNVGGWPDPGSPYDGDGTAWEAAKALRSNYAAVQPRVDVDNYLDYMIAWMFGNAEDEYRTVGPVEQAGGFKFYMNDADGWLSVNGSNQIAVWDGSDNNTGRAGTIPGRSPGDGPGSFLSAWLASGGAEFKIRLADRIAKHLLNGGALSPTRNAARLTELCSPVTVPFIAEAARWNFRSPSNWTGARDVCLNSWIPGRTTAALGQFRTAGLYPITDAPAFSQHGGAVAAGFAVGVTGPAGATLFYTLDGSDPRAVGGAVAAGAQIYSAAVPLAHNTLVRARARSATGEWSALTQAFFAVGGHPALAAGAVIPSELHFNASDANGSTEFVELMNVSTEAVNLRGAKFTAGIDFTFNAYQDTILQPGERLVIVESDYAFRRHYGWDRRVAGVYRGQLDNNGEALFLTTAADQPVFDMTWDENWQRLADGSGYSLTLIKPAGGVNLSDGANWRPSVAVDGSPNGGDGAAFTGPNPNGDDNADGITNFAHHALAGTGALVLPAMGSDPAGLTLSYQHNLAADDAAVELQTAASLGAWEPVTGAAVLEESIAAGIHSVRLLLPASFAEGRHFFRLRVTSR